MKMEKSFNHSVHGDTAKAKEFQCSFAVLAVFAVVNKALPL